MLSDGLFTGYPLPIVLRQNVTISGPGPTQLKLLDFGFVQLEPGVQLSLRWLLLRDWSDGANLGSGFDILVPQNETGASGVMLSQCIFLETACYPSAVFTEAVASTERPPPWASGRSVYRALPGVPDYLRGAGQAANVGVESFTQPCVNGSSAPPLEWCYAQAGIMDDFAGWCYMRDKNGRLKYDGHTRYYDRVLWLCESVLAHECLEASGPLYCLVTALREANARRQAELSLQQSPAQAPAGEGAGPAPAGPSSQDMASSSGGGGGGGGGMSDGAIAGTVVACVVGACVLVAALASAALLWRRRRRRRQGEDGTEPGAGKGPLPEGARLSGEPGTSASGPLLPGGAEGGGDDLRRTPSEASSGMWTAVSVSVPRSGAQTEDEVRAAAAQALAAAVATRHGAARDKSSAPCSAITLYESTQSLSVGRRAHGPSDSEGCSRNHPADDEGQPEVVTTETPMRVAVVGLRDAAPPRGRQLQLQPHAPPPAQAQAQGDAQAQAERGHSGPQLPLPPQVHATALLPLQHQQQRGEGQATSASEPRPPQQGGPQPGGLEEVVTLQPTVLGRGTFGRVVEGEYRGQRVAVKLLSDHLDVSGADGGFNEKAARTLVQEAQVLGRCCHPNIVKLLAVCLQPPRMGLVLELMETSLSHVLYGAPGAASRPPMLPVPVVLDIALDVARALEFCHPTVVHRDVKPANVLINGLGTPKLTAKISDWGLARLSNTLRPTLHPEAGTPAYVAPECFDLRNTAVTCKADMYSFGVLLYEMLSGTEPWAGETVVAIAIAVTMRGIRLPVAELQRRRPEGAVPSKLLRLIGRCFDAAPQRRPAAADAVKQLLLAREQLLYGCASPSSSAVPSSPPEGMPSRSLHGHPSLRCQLGGPPPSEAEEMEVR
ncbi:hypothetical protein HYH03_000666 [Edaphochlamys debaryana]|uniref:Protein kinase domain-containing protein n=1 Tax=Edaphochlamys debaryana TaxID=47281 RepID=A0A836C7M9_9CHLO|nr:hypothetical protein HYH03_000666 [Edaphochlamys debaryana]|eukprot:KAG2502179.1 hypothetical protein HYH03_000666 [Edaphochlamys debaryana]